MDTVKVRSFKMPFANRKFNANQRVWVVYGTGDNVVCCVGRYRGSGRYIKAWVNWNGKEKTPPQIQEFDVDAEFAKRHGLVH